MRRRLTAAGVLLILASFSAYKLKFPAKVIKYEEDEEQFITKKIKKGRVPASTPRVVPHRASPLSKPQYTFSERQADRYADFKEEEPNYQSSTIASDGPSWNMGGQFQAESRGRTRSNWNNDSQANSSSSSSSSLGEQIKTTPVFSGSSYVPTSPIKDVESKGGPSTPPTCSVNNSGGSFQGPITIELACSTNSTIKYCLSEGTCCDPEQGNVYSTPIVIGEAGKSFCLSYAGTSVEENLTSESKEAVFSFNPELPHLEMIQEKVYLQTTQLDGTMVLRSNNFGSDHHMMGVINLKAHNPSPQHLNLNCRDIVETHASLSNPSASFALSEITVAGQSSQTQMNLFLNESNLVYGENHLTSYMKSMLYQVPEYACSNTQLILEDFYYFQTLPTEEAISSSEDVLLGGFSPISSITGNNETYRGPASALDGNINDELRTGLISIFFDK